MYIVADQLNKETQSEVEILKEEIRQLRKKHESYVKASEESMELLEKALDLSQHGSSMPTSYLLYAAMQCADIYFLKADICQLGK